MLTKFYSLELIIDLPLSSAIDYILHAFEQEKEQVAWEMWVSIYPFMVSGIVKEFVKFADFKIKLFEPQRRYTQKSLDEIEQEMLSIVAKHEGR